MVSTRPSLTPEGRRVGPLEPPGPPERGGRQRLILLAGLAVAAVAGIAFALYGSGGVRDRAGPERAEAPARAEGVQPASADEGLTFSPPAAREPYRPVDREAIRRAYAQVGTVYAAEGVSGLARYGIQCFRALERAPDYATLDFCLAFDAIATAVNQRLAGDALPPANSWFGAAADRDLKVAQAVMGGEGDASARLIDIRRLAVEVAREGGPVIPAGVPAAPAAAAPSPAPVPAAAPAPAPAIVREPAAPARTTQPPTRTSTPAPAAPARRERFVAARPERAAVEQPARGAGPSFNCRYARSASERLVCRDPGLAALDRGLNAAYEEAIAAGADRRSLRAAQDRWLAVRERAAPDPDAVADVYRRRIEELGAMR